MAGKRPSFADKAPDLSRETSQRVLADWVRSALRLDRPDILHAAVRQLCRCQDMKIVDPLERAFTANLLALEQALADDSATRRRIVRTRKKLERDGAEAVLADLVLKANASDAFLRMVAFGQVENTPEALVLDHAGRFDGAVAEAARARLQEYGYDALQPS
ncbi:MAG: hypothetical protein O3B22_06300 [Proteobacteria bacterium]|nr:hypothetical protein [Pseudomonadota bacterium]MDA1072819.1 hypothetical protein [Pseudomonadota bacterium]